jgi:hypothetical protein
MKVGKANKFTEKKLAKHATGSGHILIDVPHSQLKMAQQKL